MAVTQEVHGVIYCNAHNMHIETCIGNNNNPAWQQIPSWGKSVAPLDLTTAENWALESHTVYGELVWASFLQTINYKSTSAVGLKLLKRINKFETVQWSA